MDNTTIVHPILSTCRNIKGFIANVAVPTYLALDRPTRENASAYTGNTVHFLALARWREWGFSSISALPRVNVVTSEASDESGDQQLLRLSSTPGFQKCFTSLTITEVDWDRLSPEAEAALTRPKTALM